MEFGNWEHQNKVSEHRSVVLNPGHADFILGSNTFTFSFISQHGVLQVLESLSMEKNNNKRILSCMIHTITVDHLATQVARASILSNGIGQVLPKYSGFKKRWVKQIQ